MESATPPLLDTLPTDRLRSPLLRDTPVNFPANGSDADDAAAWSDVARQCAACCAAKRCACVNRTVVTSFENADLELLREFNDAGDDESVPESGPAQERVWATLLSDISERLHRSIIIEHRIIKGVKKSFASG